MSKAIQSLLLVAAFILTSALTVAAQVNAQNNTTMTVPNRSADNQGSNVYGGYSIGVGDVLDIHVNNEDDVSGRYQVNEDGTLKVSLLSKPIQAAGSTTFDLARRLSDELKAEQILREPSVTVMIIREMTQNVSVTGAVMRPGVYPIEKPTTVAELISMAGGLAPNAGESLTIAHNTGVSGTRVANASVKSNASPVATLDVTSVLSAQNAAANPDVRAGDVITVNTAPVVFVVGSVNRPGAFAVQDRRSQMTVLQAVAMAQGTAPAASLGKTIIIRRSTSSSDRQEIPIDLKKIMRGKAKDEVLEANDILFIPQSGLKAGARRMGDIGAQAAATAAGYAVIF